MTHRHGLGQLASGLEMRHHPEAVRGLGSAGASWVASLYRRRRLARTAFHLCIETHASSLCAAPIAFFLDSGLRFGLAGDNRNLAGLKIPPG